MSLLSRISPLFISALLAAAGTLLPVGSASASTVSYYQFIPYGWSQPVGGRFGSRIAACRSYNPHPEATYRLQYTDWCYRTIWGNESHIGYAIQSTETCKPGQVVSGYSCVTPPTCTGDSTLDPVTNTCVLECESPKVPNSQTNTCDVPAPQCEQGQFYDFDSKSCKWPQDDTCSVIGASWNNTSQACQCGAGKLLVTAGGVSRCMAGGDDSCSKDSPDFKGYGPGGKAVCNASARCPNGGTPGHIGSGDQLTVVCIPDVGEGEGDGTCNGTSGIKDGVRVCIPKPGTDPDLPDCKGVVGSFGNQKVCIEPATNDSRCKPGETAGYTGVGAEMKFVCVPKGYGPETCPPGQYIINKETEGFGCVTASNDPPENDGKKPGTGTSESETTKKDANGNEIGKDKTESKFEIEGLFHDAPANNFKSEMDQFGKSALDGLNTDTLVGEFSGSDGAFTQRNSLDNASSFIKTHTIGNNASCSGTLPFLGYEVSCSKFENMNRVLGWLLFVVTILWIYNTLMRKSESGV